MIKEITHFLGLNSVKKPTTDFSAFFYDASSSEKKKLLKIVIREANNDQKDLVKKYNLTKIVCQ